jgi:hypothetical protein
MSLPELVELTYQDAAPLPTPTRILYVVADVVAGESDIIIVNVLGLAPPVE